MYVLVIYYKHYNKGGHNIMSGIVGKNLGRGSGLVKAGDVAADSVTGSEIADDAIDSEHYTDGSIDNAHIADDAIDSEHYADGSIDNAHIADDAIDSEHYADGSIDNAHIADDAIDSEHYAAASIDNAHLADNAVDTAEIADNAITLAKMAGGTDGNLISYDTSGNPVAVATGTDGQVLTSAGAGAVCLFEDAAGGGGEETDEIDMWVLDTTLDATVDNSSTVISANWARATFGGQDKLGTGLSESSGIFSFPSTGFYLISWQALIQTDAVTTNFGMHLQTTPDNSTYSFVASNYGSFNEGTGHLATHTGFFIFDVTSTTNDKFRFYYYSTGADNNFVGSGSANKTSFYCVKLANT
jgi:hypothetical protein